MCKKLLCLVQDILLSGAKSVKVHISVLTLNLLTTTIVAPPSNARKWQMGFNSAFKGLKISSFLCYAHMLRACPPPKKSNILNSNWAYARKYTPSSFYGSVDKAV
jgi:hypothetical protein